MRLQVLSDLHLEFHADRGAQFVRLLRPQGVDVLVVAGDLAVAGLLTEALSRLCDRYPRVVYVVGNHEYYDAHPDQVHEELADAADRLDNLVWLHHGTATIGGLVFAGTPLWFPPAPESGHARLWMNDFRVIRDFEPWVYDENRRATKLLESVADRADVVVTHHLPSQRSVAPQYVGSPLNPFFVCACDEVIERGQPALWVHGHTHLHADHRIGRTRVLANPFGYPGEPDTGFVEQLVVDLDSRDQARR